ncbi:uncharacterized protein A1O9_00008 [Exophiala aquamarina CBS 119918]|uniref:GST N-terminal domain-containing protein n=1 Tax=Exophiala aquamarina CBS 119918 TaxID=1182545 RepID=A0A072PQ80_9EURO|nr:uncharacterized protein A1O9_00008 [Exophiala aquamarina CBS 119918]KEF62036.1 hypothetical protein A1O9_00008 [Exophiala aquamarina CBS 119918]
MAINSTSSSEYVLYYHPYSVCSLMVLNTLVWKGSAKRREDEIAVQFREVDIFHEEQLSEDFLCNINNHGQVPVLAHSSKVDAPITDSLKITNWLATKYPDLMPTEHEAEIRQKLNDLHALNYFSLSFPGRPQIAQQLEANVQRRLQDSSISDRYRKALEFKLGVTKRDKSGGLVPAVTAENEKNAKSLLSELSDKLRGPESWIYGEKPTAIDAHLVVFIARMMDVGREQLIPEKLRDYTHWAMQKPEWVNMMGGRSTMIPH